MWLLRSAGCFNVIGAGSASGLDKKIVSLLKPYVKAAPNLLQDRNLGYAFRSSLDHVDCVLEAFPVLGCRQIFCLEGEQSSGQNAFRSRLFLSGLGAA